MTNAVNIAGLGGALTVTSGVVNFSSTPTVNSSPIGASAATPTVLGTVYAKQTTGGGSPYLTAFGSFAATNTTGELNTAVGNNALFTNVSGIRNSAFGTNALYSNTGSYNVAVGMAALQSNTSGASNVGIGYNAGFSNTTAAGNVLVGFEAGYSLTTQGDHTFVGYRAGKNTTTNGNSSAFGANALLNQTTGYLNHAFGDGALQALTTGYANSAFGTGCLGSVTTGLFNCGMGRGVCDNLTTGTHNVAIGRSSGANLVSGENNIYIGREPTASSSGVNYEYVFGAATGKGSNTGFIQPNGGGVYQGNNSSSWSTTSDRRLKKNIVDNNEGLNKLTQIQVRNFEYRTADEVTELPKDQVIKKSGVQLGAIAQELQAVLPDCVKEESTGVLTVDSDNLTWYLINAVKELKAELDALKAKVA